MDGEWRAVSIVALIRSWVGHYLILIKLVGNFYGGNLLIPIYVVRVPILFKDSMLGLVL